MNFKKSILLLPLLLLTSCGETSIVNPNYNGGLGGNEDGDQVEKVDAKELENLLKAVIKDTKYELEIISTVVGSEAEFKNYITPNAWYEDSGESSFGFANEKNTNAIFKYYLNDTKTEAYPSIYEYAGANEDGTPIKFTHLYNPFSIAHINMLSSAMSTFEAAYVSPNRYVLLDDNTISVFQYMTTYGYSLTNAMVAVYVDILSADDHHFKVTFDLGDYGDVVMTYKKVDSTPIDFVDNLVKAGTLKGVDYHNDVHEFLTEVASKNNYVLHGIKMITTNGVTDSVAYNIYCNNDYFLVDYTNPAYADWGFVLVPANKEITYKTYNPETNTFNETTQQLTYDAFYGFVEDGKGGYYFDFFKGPVESESVKYQYVDVLPLIGKPGILYIVDEGGDAPNVYEWVEQPNGAYGYSLYSTWYDTVGDGYINDMTATFYLSSSGLCDIGSYYFEKDLTKENTYYSKDTSILSTIANGLFGWGFQQTTTWISYVQNSEMTINRGFDGEIASVDLGLYIQASVEGSSGNQFVYYTMDNFGNASVASVEEFLNDII